MRYVFYIYVGRTVLGLLLLLFSFVSSDLSLAQSAGGSSGANILFILDASGSMAGQMEGKAKMDVAKSVMADLIDGLPDNVNVGLEVYGHRSKGDCDDIETMVEVGALNKQALIDRINSIQPKGKTPIAKSLAMAGDKLGASEDQTTIILVSDGEETCEGNACTYVKDLREKGINVKVHVVGFDVGQKEKEQLSCIAEAGGGRYYTANNADQLKQALTEVKEEVVAEAEPAPPAVSKLKILPKGGDRPETAVPVEPGDYEIDHAIAKNAREYFSVKLRAGQTLSAGVRTPDSENPYAGVGIYNDSGALVVHENIIGSEGVLKTVSWMTNSEKDEYTYYFSAGNEYDPTPVGTSYYIKVEDNFDIGSTTDAGDIFDKAMEMEPGKYAGYLTGDWGYDKKDYYALPMKSEQKLSIKVTPATDTGFNLTVLDQDRVIVAQKSSANAGAITRLSWTATEDQEVVYVLVEPASFPGKSSALKYDISVTLE
ncbi:MAG: VWA domain-containing protein [Thermodesulfobacteriota bacterium]